MLVDFQYKGKDIRFSVHPELTKIGKREIPRDNISSYIYRKKRFYETSNLEQSLSHIKNSSVVVDCGANIGNHSIFWSLFAKKVYAIEPFEKNFLLLRENIANNKCTNVVAINSLLGCVENKYDVVSSKDNFGATYFVENIDGKYISQPLDSLISERIDFLKIDVEGFEKQVIAGANTLIFKFKPFICLEMHYPVNSAEYQSILRDLKYLGYTEGLNLFISRKKLSHM